MNALRVGEDPTSAAQDATLLDEIGSIFCTELANGNAVVSITAGAHRRLLEKRLTVHGIDIVAALSKGQYVPLNALETLSTIIVDGVLDVIRFAEVVGAPIDRAAANHPRVLIFGELVPLMRADGKHAGADALDNLWRSFVASRPTFVHCAYPTNTMHNMSSTLSSPRASHTSNETGRLRCANDHLKAHRGGGRGNTEVIEDSGARGSCLIEPRALGARVPG